MPQVPEGRPKTDLAFRSSLRDLTGFYLASNPGDESPGYCRTPLRGKTVTPGSRLACDNEALPCSG
jgi:hypothetical protein